MNINDPIGDMITRIRNAHMRGKEIVDTPSSSLRVNVLEVLKAEGLSLIHISEPTRPY